MGKVREGKGREGNGVATRKDTVSAWGMVVPARVFGTENVPPRHDVYRGGVGHGDQRDGQSGHRRKQILEKKNTVHILYV